ncbi:MAG: DUF4132 domain-containing protein [Phycisphaerales bacterium]|nr:DUF4132 domain-containing protein [Phycisphaerales bacterium]
MRRASPAEKFLKGIEEYVAEPNVPYEDVVRIFAERCNELDRSDRYELCVLILRARYKEQEARKEKMRRTGQRGYFLTHYLGKFVSDALLMKSVSKLKPTPAECCELFGLFVQIDHAISSITAFSTLLRYVTNNWDEHKQHPELAKFIPEVIRQLKESGSTQHRKLAAYLWERIEGETFMPLDRGEAWSDAALARIELASATESAALKQLFIHAASCSGSKPSKKWLKTARESISTLTRATFNDALLELFPLVDRPRTQPSPHRDWREGALGEQLILDHHADILKGLCWMASDEEDEEIARALGALAISCYRKLPGVGPRAVKIGNAAVYALGAMPGRAAIGQLAILRIKLKMASAQKLVLKALDRVAEREGIPRDQIEEMAVPSYGLDEVGFGEEQLGEYTARLSVSSSGNTSPCKLIWVNPKGKEVKSVPAAIKEQFPDELKELKASAKDINKMLPVQRDRIDGLFLERRSWDLDVWRQRYLDHPLIGTIARRLIWVFTSGETQTAAAWLAHDPQDGAHGDGQLVRVDGSLFKPESGSTVTIWHPIREDAQPGQDPVRSDLIDWRRFYEERGIVQPFKQAHREVYLLTDAERNTELYSNRFAAHILRQHQFNALAIGRFWKNQLRIMADMECHAPRRDLGAWGIRAEFWVEGIGDNYEDEYVSPSGAFLYLATDQVRFYAIEAAQNMGHAWGGQYRNRGADEDLNHPIPLDQIPPIVLSETLRDVDLFVGVASVGNNPEWADGGPQGRFQDYWQSYSFGTLSGTAQTRKELLGRLVPRLKIASQCELKDKFLVVRGNIRTYKIHLGSGNILMEPNDQYLCIVPTSSMSRVPGGGKVHLPFEGDRVLAIILSKAFMLADDHKITDKTILTQINR